MESSNKKILLIGAAGIGFLLWQATQEVKNTIGALSFSFGAGGVPSLVGLSQIEIPIKVTVSNTGFTDLPLQSVNITLMRITKTGSYAFAATEPGGVGTPIIKARANNTFILPVRTGPLELLTEILTTLQHLGVNKFAVTGTIQAGGLSLPISPVTFTT